MLLLCLGCMLALTQKRHQLYAERQARSPPEELVTLLPRCLRAGLQKWLRLFCNSKCICILVLYGAFGLAIIYLLIRFVDIVVGFRLSPTLYSCLDFILQ